MNLSRQPIPCQPPPSLYIPLQKASLDEVIGDGHEISLHGSIEALLVEGGLDNGRFGLTCEHTHTLRGERGELSEERGWIEKV